MKNLMIILAIITMIVATACNQDNDKKNVETNDMQMSEMEHNHAGNGDAKSSSMEHEGMNMSENSTMHGNVSTSQIVDAYLKIKNALVNDDKEAAAQGGEELLTAFSEFDMMKLSESQHKEYMDIYEDAKEQAEHIIKSPIDHQREHFEILSADIYDLIKLLGTEKTLYQDFCPMANDGKGALWLSEFKEIKNPFYGSKMLTCGSVKNTIK